jgi:hypothetical protein
MSDIEYIKNVTVAHRFASSPGTFTHTITGLPLSSNPDECVIRAFNFNGDASDFNLYFIWCSLTNDYIGSFCGGSIAPHFPQTRIRLNSPVPNMLEFKLYTPTANGMVHIDSTVGELGIHMDFIKYRNVTPHA